MKNGFIRGSVLALTLSVAGLSSLYAQDAKATPNERSEAQANQQGNTQPGEAKAFTGTIVKDGDRLVLQEAASKVSYKVDDESKVKDYIGKQVKITGSLDASTNVIHVDSIEVVS